MTDIYSLLEADHRKARETLRKIQDASEGSEEARRKLFDKLKEELELHMQFEEDKVYPAGRKDAGMEEEVEDDLEEHAEAKSMLREITSLEPASVEFLDKIEELEAALQHHIGDEEQELFPAMREAHSSEWAESCGREYRELKKKTLGKAA